MRTTMFLNGHLYFSMPSSPSSPCPVCFTICSSHHVPSALMVRASEWAGGDMRNVKNWVNPFFPNFPLVSILLSSSSFVSLPSFSLPVVGPRAPPPQFSGSSARPPSHALAPPPIPGDYEGHGAPSKAKFADFLPRDQLDLS